MKLYFSPGLCSLAPHIALREAGLPFDLVQVDVRAKKTKDGGDFFQINPKGQVPTLELAPNNFLTEVPVILQYVADQAPAANLVPACGRMERYRVQEWLNFITSELHKSFSPLFRPTTPDDYKPLVRELIANRFNLLDKHLAGRQYLVGDDFTIADAYLFVMTNWASGRLDSDLARWPNLSALRERVLARPKVQEAMKAEGLIN
jgi:glutathione S-transferase